MIAVKEKHSCVVFSDLFLLSLWFRQAIKIAQERWMCCQNCLTTPYRRRHFNTVGASCGVCCMLGKQWRLKMNDALRAISVKKQLIFSFQLII